MKTIKTPRSPASLIYLWLSFHYPTVFYLPRIIWVDFADSKQVTTYNNSLNIRSFFPNTKQKTSRRKNFCSYEAFLWIVANQIKPLTSRLTLLEVDFFLLLLE